MQQQHPIAVPFFGTFFLVFKFILKPKIMLKKSFSRYSFNICIYKQVYLATPLI